MAQRPVSEYFAKEGESDSSPARKKRHLQNQGFPGDIEDSIGSMEHSSPLGSQGNVTVTADVHQPMLPVTAPGNPHQSVGATAGDIASPQTTPAVGSMSLGSQGFNFATFLQQVGWTPPAGVLAKAAQSSRSQAGSTSAVQWTDTYVGCKHYL